MVLLNIIYHVKYFRIDMKEGSIKYIIQEYDDRPQRKFLKTKSLLYESLVQILYYNEANVCMYRIL